MSGLPVFLLAVVVALSLGAQTASPAKGKVVEVEIIFGTRTDHDAACQKGNVLPRTVFLDLDTKKPRVHHCIGTKLLDHANEKANPEAFEPALVRLSSGDAVHWYSASRLFKVVEVRQHDEDRAKPLYPFVKPIPAAEFTKEVTSPAVIDVPGAAAVVERYKVTFELQGLGRFDPDLVCSM